MSIFDPHELDRLAHDVANWPFMVTFAEKYRRLLPHRVVRIVDATEAADVEVAMDAILSLRVASTIVGTHELAEMARFVEVRLRLGDVAAAQTRVRLLPAAADRADRALASYLLQHAG